MRISIGMEDFVDCPGDYPDATVDVVVDAAVGAAEAVGVGRQSELHPFVPEKNASLLRF